MEIKRIDRNREQFIEWLLIADEQLELVEAYVSEGDMWVLEDNWIKIYVL